MQRAATTILTCAVFAAAMLACAAKAQAQWKEPGGAAVAESRESQAARFREAMRLHRAGRWSAAYGRFAVLADEGYVPASRVALAMLRNGPRVYGTDWSAAPSQVASWEGAVGERSTLKMAVAGE